LIKKATRICLLDISQHQGCFIVYKIWRLFLQTLQKSIMLTAKVKYGLKALVYVASLHCDIPIARMRLPERSRRRLHRRRDRPWRRRANLLQRRAKRSRRHHRVDCRPHADRFLRAGYFVLTAKPLALKR
jgi:hypothetical protein